MRPGLHAARNILKAVLLLGGYVAGLAALGWWLDGFRAASVFFVVALLMAATVHVYGGRVLLQALRARELLLGEAPVLHSTAERLAMAAGVARPKLYAIDHSYPLALSVGRGASDVGIALSRGLLGMATPAELEGILSHELAHARNRDNTVQTPVVLLAVWLVEASRIGGYLERALLYILAPVAASLVQVTLSPRREFAADETAAGICGSPHGLADALVALDQAMQFFEFRASPATEPIYIVSPFGRDRLAAMFATHPSLEERIGRLRALDPESRERQQAA
jgi:heat shock protein HtpX